MMSESVVIAEYDPRWPQMFQDEAVRVRDAVPDDLLLGIEHFGSTAVPGLAAKPVIDLMVFVRSLERARREAVLGLEALGYSFWRDNPVPSPLFFVKGLPPHGPRTHHIHMAQMDDADPKREGMYFRDRLLFRDYLRTNPDAVLRYAALKHDLAARFPNDREAYTEGKSEFIFSVLGQTCRAMSEAIVIVDYDSRWPAQFEEIAAQVQVALGPDINVAIEHIGSTSVPGLAAKPIIDLDVVIPSVADLPNAIVHLEALGYVHRGDLGIAGREAFQSPTGGPHHHLYVCPMGNAELRRHLVFRDYLRAHPGEAQRYGDLKHTLAERFRADRKAYTNAKNEFIASILRKAQEQQPSGSPELGRGSQ